MSAAQALAMSFGLIAWLMFIAFVLLHAGGGFLVRRGKLTYIIKGCEANDADLPVGTKISYGRLAVIALAIAVACSITFVVL